MRNSKGNLKVCLLKDPFFETNYQRMRKSEKEARIAFVENMFEKALVDMI